jgi:hypothetical protein
VIGRPVVSEKLSTKGSKVVAGVRHRRRILGFVLIRFAAVSLLFLAASDSDIYYGKKENARKPAEIKATDVFNEIAEYKKIKEKGLTKDDAEYWVLLNKANEKFNKALKKVVEEDKYDVVAEKGKVKFDTTPADITKKVIEALGKKEK